MACQTCGHTMTGIANGVFWCPRCGSVSDFTNGITDHVVPKLVGRCREFQMQHRVGTGLGSQYANNPLMELWHRLGIAESIALPAERAQTS